jgi:Eco57I restriction-modification methylase
VTAIKNIGELASPYFLLEVWARREEIDIDPETYATLKRKARALVRDARAFEVRDEEPDADWQARRLELLGLEDAKELTVTLEEDTSFALGRWRDDTGHDAVLVGDLPGIADPDRRTEQAQDPPSAQFELALDAYQGEADWGVLLAATKVRVYRRSSGISQQYLELDLDSLVELDDETTWKAFAAIFRATAFRLGADGVPLIRRVVDESRRHASALAADMRADVVDAAEAIMQGALDHPANAELLSEPSRTDLLRLFEETLYYLYRILFVLYAEARDVLPVSGAGAYATTYSADHLIELARAGHADRNGTYFGDTLRRLFDLLQHGPAEAAQALGVDPVGGELFDPERTRLLDRCRIADPAWARALTSIALGAPESARRKLGRRSSFAELGVDQLGSIYEGLLVLEPYLAPGPRVLVSVDGDRRVLEADQTDGYRVLRHLEAGDFVLESASGRRKGSGSFYTPHEITEYLTRAALDPIVEPIVDLAADDPHVAARDLLALRVCDPAMGSGAFLVQAARVLGLALARIRAAGVGGRVTPEMVHQAERIVVRDCLYGVDLNPLAVALAKVSLWLETLERGKPLSFLDTRLRCGDSLIGVDFTTEAGELSTAELAAWPAGAAKGLITYLKNEAGERGEPMLERLKKRRAPKEAVQAKLPGIDSSAIEEALGRIAEERLAVLAREAEGETLEDALQAAEAFRSIEVAEESLRNRVRAAADFWCAQWFSDGEDAPADVRGPVTPATAPDFETILARLLEGQPVPERLLPQLAAAQRVAARRHFFHWALEFPEVMVERGGFDAVIGNPPWNTLSPDVKEFFSTYDPTVFHQGVPKADQEARKAELRLDPDVDAAWRTQARFLHELSAYAKPASGRFRWFAPDGQLRKGDANVFRLFVERAYTLLRSGGRLGQVLPDSVYVSSPATGVRQRLLTEGVLERCYVFENRKELFPIHRSVKVVLLVTQRGDGPTEQFKAAFFVGKDAAGGDRAVGLNTIPDVLAELDREAPKLSVVQIRALAPSTWSFPELQTALDAEVAAQCATVAPPLNLDDRGWGLTYCAELHADRDAWRFKEMEYLERLGARREGLRWIDADGMEWWPLVEGQLFYNLEFPAQGKEPRYWVSGPEVVAIEARKWKDGTPATSHYRVAWRDVARAVDERSAIACVLSPRTAAKDTSLTVWGGLLNHSEVLALAALMSSFTFDYLVRFGGKTHLKYAAINPIPAPSIESLTDVLAPAAEAVCWNSEFDELWSAIHPNRPRPALDPREIAERRARIDAVVANAYQLSLPQYAAVLCSFPNLDRSQPMLPGEPKSFVTRDLALLTYCQREAMAPPNVPKLMREIGVDLPDPKPEFRKLDDRVAAYRDLGAVPYRPTPRGGKTPTDPALIAEAEELLGTDPMTVEEIAEALEQEEKTIRVVLKQLQREGVAFREGSGKRARYYVVEEG